MSSWTLVLFPILIGTVALSSEKVARRFIMKDKMITPLQLLIHLYAFLTLTFGLIYLTCWGFQPPKLLPGFWRAVLLGTLVNLFIQFFSMKAASIDEGEVSLTAPLFAMTPGLITVLAITLGEYPSKIGVAGIFCMSAGSYVLLFEKSPEHWWEYIGPLRRISLLFKIGHLSPKEKGKTIVVILSLASAALGTFGLLFDGLYVRRGINFQGLTLAMITLMGLLAGGYAVWFLVKPDTKNRKRDFGLSHYKNQPKYLLTLACMVVCWIVMMYGFQATYNHTYVAYVGTLKRLSILTSVLMGYFLFHEGEIKKRLMSAILIILGVILISMDDLPTRISAQMQIWGF